MYTCRHPSSLFTVFAEKKKITRVQALPFCVFLFASTFGNLKHRLLDSPETKRQGEVQRQNCLQETVGKIDPKFSIFLRRSGL